jgi:hypothetical protein
MKAGIKHLKFEIIITSTLLLGVFSTNGQDSIKVKNRHDIPDTTNDAINPKGGALIDTINIKETPERKRMNQKDTTSFNNSISDFHLLAFQDERNSKIESLEKEINSLKESMKTKKDVALKSNIASLENKKNDLKSRLKNAPAPDSKEMEKWNLEYNELKEKVEKLKTKFAQ